MKCEIANCLARPESRIARHSAYFEQTHRAVPMRTHRLEQLDHLRIVDRAAEQRPADQLRQVVVTDRQRIGIAEGPLRGLGGRPHTDTG